MIKKQRLKLGHVPTLLVYRNNRKTAAGKGCILFYHGLGASKDSQVKELQDLADHGFLVVGIDNVGHGERRYPDFDKRFSGDSADVERELQAAVLESAREIPVIIGQLRQKRLIVRGKIGIAGISMGGFIVYTAIALVSELRVAASILGSPKWRIDQPESPHYHLGAFSSIRLLSQNAGRDQAVPPQHARLFHQRLKEHYPDYEERYEYIEYPRSGHFMREDDWDTCWTRAIGWFERHFS